MRPALTFGAETSAAGVALADCAAAIVGSSAEAGALVAAGLSGRARIYRSGVGPSLFEGRRIIPLDDHVSRDRLVALGGAARDLAIGCHGAVREVPYLQDVALGVATAAFVQQRLVYLAHLLGEAMFAAPIAISEWAADAKLPERIPRLPWRRLFANHPQTVWFTVPAEAMPTVAVFDQVEASLPTRLRFEDWQSIGYRAAEKLFRALPSGFRRGTVLVGSENALVKETALHLALGGLRLQRLRPPKATGAGLDAAERRELGRRIEPLCREFVARFCIPSLRETVLALVMGEIAETASRDRVFARAWRSELASGPVADARLVLTGNTSKSEDRGLFHATRGLGLRIASFQHGVTREICIDSAYSEPLWEIAASDFWFCFNERNARVTDRCRLGLGRSVAVGCPADLAQAARGTAAPPKGPPILYVSTCLYMALRQLPSASGIADTAKAKSELRLIEHVLARLPHEVAYKPYPTTRQIDPDPVLQQAAATGNIRLVRDRRDLRYMLGAYRVFVMARATSTLSWLMVSEKPVVYIDYPDQHPLLDSARDALAAAVFVFDGGDEDFQESLRSFLSQPISAIEAAARQKTEARRQFCREFIGLRRGSAGRRAAAFLRRQLAAAGQSP